MNAIDHSRYVLPIIHICGLRVEDLKNQTQKGTHQTFYRTAFYFGQTKNVEDNMTTLYELRIGHRK